MADLAGQRVLQRSLFAHLSRNVHHCEGKADHRTGLGTRLRWGTMLTSLRLYLFFCSVFLEWRKVRAYMYCRGVLNASVAHLTVNHYVPAFVATILHFIHITLLFVLSCDKMFKVEFGTRPFLGPGYSLVPTIFHLVAVKKNLSVHLGTRLAQTNRMRLI